MIFLIICIFFMNLTIFYPFFLFPLSVADCLDPNCSGHGTCVNGQCYCKLNIQRFSPFFCGQFLNHFHYSTQSNNLIKILHKFHQVKPVGRVKIAVLLINKYINACLVAQSMVHTIWKLERVFVIVIGLEQIVHKVRTDFTLHMQVLK